MVRDFAKRLDIGEDLSSVRERLNMASHNTGSVQNKLAKLDRSIGLA